MELLALVTVLFAAIFSSLNSLPICTDNISTVCGNTKISDWKCGFLCSNSKNSFGTDKNLSLATVNATYWNSTMYGLHDNLHAVGIPKKFTLEIIVGVAVVCGIIVLYILVKLLSTVKYYPV